MDEGSATARATRKIAATGTGYSGSTLDKVRTIRDAGERGVVRRGETEVPVPDEIGVSVDSLRTYRDVAHAWPSPNRVGDTCWKVHQVLMGHQHLIREGMTVTEASNALGHHNTGRTGSAITPGRP